MASSILNQLRKQKHQKTLEQSSSEIINSLPSIQNNDEPTEQSQNREENQYTSYIETPIFNKTTEIQEKTDTKPQILSSIVNFREDNLRQLSSNTATELEREEISTNNIQAQLNTEAENLFLINKTNNIEKSFNIKLIDKYLHKRRNIINNLISSQTKYYKRENAITSIILGISLFMALGISYIGFITLWPCIVVAFMTWKVRDEEIGFNIKKDIFRFNIYERIFTRRHIKNKQEKLAELNQARSEIFNQLFESIEDELKKEHRYNTSTEKMYIESKLNSIKEEIKNFNLFEDDPEKSKEIFDSLCIHLSDLNSLYNSPTEENPELDFINKKI